MKVRADEHVSRKIVRILSELALSPEFSLSSVYDVGQDGTSDQYWATSFSRDGGKAILSADTDFFRKPHQVAAIDSTGLKVIHLPPRWANAQAHLQAAHILMWWPRIEKTLATAKDREVWVVQWNITESGKLKRRKVDYAAFRKKVKKAARRTS